MAETATERYRREHPETQYETAIAEGAGQAARWLGAAAGLPALGEAVARDRERMVRTRAPMRETALAETYARQDAAEAYANDPGVNMTDMVARNEGPFTVSGSGVYDYVPRAIRRRMAANPGMRTLDTDAGMATVDVFGNYLGRGMEMNYEGRGGPGPNMNPYFTQEQMDFANNNMRAGGGGGGLTINPGPGSFNYTPQQWESMTNAQRIQANVDAYNAQTEALREVNTLRRGGSITGGRRRRASVGLSGAGNMPSGMTPGPDFEDTFEDIMRISNVNDRRAALKVFGNLERERMATERAMMANALREQQIASDRSYQQGQLGLGERELAQAEVFRQMDAEAAAAQRAAEERAARRDFEYQREQDRLNRGLEREQAYLGLQPRVIGQRIDPATQQPVQIYGMPQMPGVPMYPRIPMGPMANYGVEFDPNAE